MMVSHKHFVTLVAIAQMKGESLIWSAKDSHQLLEIFIILYRLKGSL